MVMSISEFKKKIAQRYETTLDNVVLSYNEREFKGASSHYSRPYSHQKNQEEDESKMVLRSTLGLHEKSIVKISFKQKPQSLETRGISARKAQRTRIHQPVQILGASLDPICQSRSKEIPKKGQPNLSVRKARNDHESGNVIITTEQTEKMFDCSESLNETVVNEQTGILQQYFSYQEQMNNKHPQRRKKVVGTHAIVSPQNFNHPTFQCAPSNFGGNSYQSDLKSITPQAAQMPYTSGLFYKTGNPSQRKASISSSKNEIWKQALQRLNDPSNKVAMISQVESDNSRYAQSALDVRRNCRRSKRCSTKIDAGIHRNIDLQQSAWSQA